MFKKIKNIVLKTDRLLYKKFGSDNSTKPLENIKEAKIIFSCLNDIGKESTVRFVGGCVRKAICGDNIDDIDLATSFEPDEVKRRLNKENIKLVDTGISHGTVTVIINKKKFEITTLRKDVSTDGRHAKVVFSKDWKKDSERRDFTINSIYSDKDGNLFDPNNGKKDLENGLVNFIGDTDKRIKEDYLRILRYLRFFLNYSKQPHNLHTIKSLKINIGGISQLSKERLLDELKKIIKIETLEILMRDKLSLELIKMIFPELKNIKIFSNMNIRKQHLLKKSDFIFMLSLMIIDGTDNVDYFLYKFNISNKDKKRIKNIDNFFKEKVNSKAFAENNMNKFFYYNGKETTIDILNYRMIKLKKDDYSLNELCKHYENSVAPIMPINADLLMKNYEIPEGKLLGEKLKLIEEEWVKNNFKISDQQVENIVKN